MFLSSLGVGLFQRIKWDRGGTKEIVIYTSTEGVHYCGLHELYTKVLLCLYLSVCVCVSVYVCMYVCICVSCTYSLHTYVLYTYLVPGLINITAASMIKVTLQINLQWNNNFNLTTVLVRRHYKFYNGCEASRLTNTDYNYYRTKWYTF